MTVNLSMLAGAGFQFLDNNGDPLTGGKVYTYLAGSTTPVTTYTTNAGTTAHTNPIVLDAAGRVPSGGEIWLTNGVSHKFVVKTSTEVTIGTYDNILNNIGNVYSALSAPDGSSLVGYTPSGTGAVATTVQNKLREMVSVKDFGAVGDWNGTTGTDDRDAILAALTYAAGRTVVFESGKTYLIGSAIVFSGDVSMKSDGVEKATIFQNGQSFVPLNIQGSTFKTTSLSASQQVNNRIWQVADTSGVTPGMLMEVKSAAAWYYDDRGVAKKSELHRVTKVDGVNIHTEDPANDGYNAPTEVVTVTFYAPVSVFMDNIQVKCVLDAPSPTAAAVTGLQLYYCADSILRNVDVDGAAYTGVYVNGCYKTLIYGGQTNSANNLETGYGVQTYGSTHTTVKDRKFWQCRRGVDISGGAVISMHSIIEGCTNMGGGSDAEGTPYGYYENGSLGSPQFGFGSHGPADHTIYRNNRVSNMWNGFVLRGGNEVVENNYYIGRSRNGVIYASFGENLTAVGNIVVDGYQTSKGFDEYDGNIPDVVLTVTTTSSSNVVTVTGAGQDTSQIQVGAVITGHASISAGAYVTYVASSTQFYISAASTGAITGTATFAADQSRRADCFLNLFASHSGGAITVNENTVQLRDKFLVFSGGSSAVKSGLTACNNKIRFSRNPNTGEVWFAFNSGAAAFAASWKLVNNDYARDDGGTGLVTRFRSISANSTTQLGDAIYSGTYTPTATPVANVTSVTTLSGQYLVVGNMVSVSGRFLLTPISASTYTQLRITLPVAPANFGAATIGGTGNSQIGDMALTVSADGTNNEALFTGTPTVNAGRYVYFNFSYRLS